MDTRAPDRNNATTDHPSSLANIIVVLYFIYFFYSVFITTIIPYNTFAQMPSMACLGNCPSTVLSRASQNQLTAKPTTKTAASPNHNTAPISNSLQQPTTSQVSDTPPSTNPAGINTTPGQTWPAPSGQTPTGAQTTACMAPKDDLFLNPFNKRSAHHRPIGTGAEYAADNDPATLDWLQVSGMNVSVGTNFGSVVADGKASDPLVTVIYNTATPRGYGTGAGLPATVHIPTSLTTGTNSDAAADIFDTATETLHEFYRLYTNNGRYTAAIHRPLSLRGLGHAEPGQSTRVGVTASGMAVAVGLLRGHETNTPGYKIEHALQLSVPRKRGQPMMLSTEVVWPASGTDNGAGTGGTNTGHVPYGGLLAIPPESKGGPNLDTLGLSEVGKRVAEALRDYGMYEVDGAGSANIRTDQFVSNAAQIKVDLEKVHKYIRLVTNSGTGPVAGGGEPIAPNCAFDVQ